MYMAYTRSVFGTGTCPMGIEHKSTYIILLEANRTVLNGHQSKFAQFQLPSIYQTNLDPITIECNALPMPFCFCLGVFVDAYIFSQRRRKEGALTVILLYFLTSKRADMILGISILVDYSSLILSTYNFIQKKSLYRHEIKKTFGMCEYHLGCKSLRDELAIKKKDI